jgi:hypothetical protein
LMLGRRMGETRVEARDASSGPMLGELWST